MHLLWRSVIIAPSHARGRIFTSSLSTLQNGEQPVDVQWKSDEAL